VLIGQDDVREDVIVGQVPEYHFANPELVRHKQLLQQIIGVLVRDEQFLAAWLWGSFARSQGDAQSDLDIHVAVADDAHSALVSHWGELIDRVSPTIYKRLLRFGGTTVLNAITPDWQRFDLTVEPLSEIGRPIGSPRILLFDRAEINNRLGPLRPEPPVGTDQLRILVEDFLRVLGLLTVVVKRGEYLVGVDGAMLLRRYLIDLMLADNAVTRGGVLRLNNLLAPDQRRTLDELPPLAPTRESVIEAHLACARAFRPLARHLLRRRGVDFPEQFDTATLAHLNRNLGIRLE
jgi:predicted nucleotidyltransferase